MKKSLLVVIVLLCMASLMAAMAYNSAKVTSAAELKIVNTNQAILALEPNGHFNWGTNMAGTKDKTVVVKDGELFFQIGKGVLDQFRGLQPNSEYVWKSLFTLRNLSNETINVTVRAEGDFAQYITFGSGSQNGVREWGEQGQPYTFNNIKPMKAQGDMWIIRNVAVKVSIPSGVKISPQAIVGSIIVESESIND